MSQNSIYRYAQPSSLQPPATSDWAGCPGWAPNDRIVVSWAIDELEEIREDTIRACGILNLGDNHGKVTSSKIMLDPVVGVNGFFKSIITEMDFGRGLETIENVQEFGRLVHDINEASYYDGDMMGMSDALQENMCGAIQNYSGTDSFKPLLPLGVQFGSSDVASQLPFSVDLKICANSSTLPGSKVKRVQLSFILQDATKCGVRCVSQGSSIIFDYRISNFDVKYIADPLSYKGDVVLKIINNTSAPYVLNKVSGLTFQVASPTKAVWATFIKNDHNNTSIALPYNYLESEALDPKIASLELKVNGMNDAWQYPLTQLNQIVYNYLLAIHEGEYPLKHALSYAKLNQPLKTGFGIGACLTQEYPATTTVTFNLTLQDQMIANQSYRVYFYSQGELKV